VIAALRYEWVRITTIRSTYWLTGAAWLIGTTFSTLIAWGTSTAAGNEGIPFDELLGIAPGVTTQGATYGAPHIVGYLAAIIGVLTWGHEYRHGMIRSTLTALPSRTTVWAAKLVVTGAWIVGLMIVSFALSSFSGWLFLRDNGIAFLGSSTLKTEGKTLVTVVLLTWFAMAITALFRHQTAALVLLFIWPLIIETIITLIFVLVPSFQDNLEITNYLPFNAMERIYQLPLFMESDTPFSTERLTVTEAVLVFGGYVAAAMVGSLVLLRSRDA
jgi:ABC-type transport system involved in multi-copper enzyme maturation permease subunit